MNKNFTEKLKRYSKDEIIGKLLKSIISNQELESELREVELKNGAPLTTKEASDLCNTASATLIGNGKLVSVNDIYGGTNLINIADVSSIVKRDRDNVSSVYSLFVRVSGSLSELLEIQISKDTSEYIIRKMKRFGMCL